jgi:F0F1-type ATP synthase membrane subunit a
VTINWNRKRRWVALILLLAGVAVMLWIPPVIPVIQLPGEVYPAGWDIPILGLRITNTFMGSVLCWTILALLTTYVARNMPKSGAETPRGGFYNMFEMLFEGLYGFIEGIAAGPYFGVIFKVFMTIFLIVLFSNWQSIVPGVDSIGFLEPHIRTETVTDPETGEEIQAEIVKDGYDVYRGFLGISYLNGKCPWVSPEEEHQADEAAVANSETAAEDARQDAERAIARAQEAGEDTSALISPANAAETARQEVLDAREAEKQARRDAGCVSGIGAPATAGHDEGATAEGEHVESEGAVGEAAETTESETEAVAAEGEHAEETAGEAEGGHHFTPGDPSVPWVVLPFFRPPSTDLNLTLGLALVAVFMTQATGIRALGASYFTKFFNFRTLFNSPLGGIDVAVGLLELIGEVARILSFAFRLLGNVFAGSVLLFVMSFLVPFLPWPFFILEFFVGIIQALVFGLLAAIFMNLATISHHHEEEHAEEGAH